MLTSRSVLKPLLREPAGLQSLSVWGCPFFFFFLSRCCCPVVVEHVSSCFICGLPRGALPEDGASLTISFLGTWVPCSALTCVCSAAPCPQTRSGRMSFSMISSTWCWCRSGGASQEGPVRRGAGRTGLLIASAWLVSVSAHQMLPVCACQAEEREGMRP